MKTLLLKIVAVGRLKNSSCQSLGGEFLKRLSAYAKMELVELKDDSVEKESAAILKQLERERDTVVVLDERGDELISMDFARLLESRGGRIVLVVGGAFGFTDAVRERADRLLALSRMTFPHEIARVVLLEQLYRAATILAGKKYHHE